jgi:hypothetical protein
MSDRRDLNFNNADEVIADVKNLRKGWKPTTGQWTLPQICWHLDVAMRGGMTPNPGASDTPEQSAMKPRLVAVLQSGKVPTGVKAPERATPPADVGEVAIDAFLATLEKFKTYPGPFGPHRLFGVVTDDQMRRLQMIHCAHHLTYLNPEQLTTNN